ncbi:MAG TPA: hypothetical protein VMU16_02270 [Candidatus Binataceae bacterium]|nr:hypothetical protein [Candidatus Binataceae bacterium]
MTIRGNPSTPAPGQASGGSSDAPRFVRGWSPIVTVAAAIFLVLSWHGECWAYIDPNAGGFIAQTLAPLMAIFLSFIFYCRKEIRRLIKSVRDRWKGSDPSGATDKVRK